MTNRAYNFSAGPATLPLEVLQTAQSALVDYHGTGIGIMELSHRSAEFDEIINNCEANFRELLGIDDSFAIMLPSGGATLQFSMVPMNLLQPNTTANYILTGAWAEKAWKEARKFGKTHVAASTKENNYAYLPDNVQISENASYLHFTSNNTITGTQFLTEPESGDVPLICDASSDLLHKAIDISKYGLIYAGAQKNLGPAGVCIVIIRKNLLERSSDTLPAYLNYTTHAKSLSMFNTPATFPIFVVGEVLKWLKRNGGLKVMEEKNRKKAAILYDAIDKSSLFEGIARKDARSVMNVTFRIADENIQKRFITEATANGLAQLKGHRSVGGLRASIYNAFPEEGVKTLVDFMKEFEKSQS